MRTFPNFPKDGRCPICGTNDNRECFVLSVDGTEDDPEVVFTHVDCFDVQKFQARYKADLGFIYFTALMHEEKQKSGLVSIDGKEL